MSEIQAIIRQITASVTFLPLLEEPCAFRAHSRAPREPLDPPRCACGAPPAAGSFDLLVYTDADVAVPRAWEESDPRYITNSSEVRLRSFTTSIHKVDTMVSYKAAREDEV